MVERVFRTSEKEISEFSNAKRDGLNSLNIKKFRVLRKAVRRNDNVEDSISDALSDDALSSGLTNLKRES